MTEKNFSRIYFVTSAIIFIIVAVRAYLVPFCHDEAATFFYYIQSGNFLPYKAHIDANNHILNSFLAWICFHLFGSSPLSLRIPNLLALLVLIWGVYRLSKKLTNTYAKLLLTSGFLLSFHWLSFFMVCRGYGISMALLVLAINCLAEYIHGGKTSTIVKAYLALQLALSANLSLLYVVLIITLLVMAYQAYTRSFFKLSNLIVLVLHLCMLAFWIKFCLFLQRENAFYAGVGDSLWRVTFVSLIKIIIGRENHLINMSCLLAYVVLMVIGAVAIIKKIRNHESNVLAMLFLILLFNGLIVAFYLSKKLLGVNYPEDRAAFFFYAIFIVLAAYIVDSLNPSFAKPIGIAVFSLCVVHFACFLNFSKHSLPMYDTMPQRFYDELADAQKQNKSQVTIGGNRLRELFYAFMNYRNGGYLNTMSISEKINTMDMNADYYVALKRDRAIYKTYYDEQDSDKYYGFTLLKRKQFLEKKPLFVKENQRIQVNNDKEFFPLIEVNDTIFKDDGAIGVECNFKVKDGDVPSNGWFVLSLDSAEGKTAYYRRVPMNYLKRDWLNQGSDGDIIIETGPLPRKIHRLVVYLWNVKRQKLDIQLNYLKMFQLEGLGANISYTYPGPNGF